MDNWIRATGFVGFITSNHTESARYVEIQSREILLVNIDLCRPFLFCKFHESRTIAKSTAVAVYKEHFYCAKSQPDKSRINSIVSNGVEIHVRKIIRYQRCLYLLEVFTFQKTMRGYNRTLPYSGKHLIITLIASDYIHIANFSAHAAPWWMRQLLRINEKKIRKD